MFRRKGSLRDKKEEFSLYEELDKTRLCWTTESDNNLI